VGVGVGCRWHQGSLTSGILAPAGGTCAARCNEGGLRLVPLARAARGEVTPLRCVWAGVAARDFSVAPRNPRQRLATTRACYTGSAESRPGIAAKGGQETAGSD